MSQPSTTHQATTTQAAPIQTGSWQAPAQAPATGATATQTPLSQGTSTPPAPPQDARKQVYKASNLLRLLIVELIGTWMLTQATSPLVAAKLHIPVAGAAFGSFAVTASFGLALMLAVYLGAPYGDSGGSGGHFNPTITLSAAMGRKCPWLLVPVYIGGQMVGGWIAPLVTYQLYGDKAVADAALGAALPAAGTPWFTVFFCEYIGTAILSFTAQRVSNMQIHPAVKGIAVGGCLTVMMLFFAPVSGGSFNWARSFGPMFWADKWTDWWVYLLAQLLAAPTSTLLMWTFAGTKPASQAA